MCEFHHEFCVHDTAKSSQCAFLGLMTCMVWAEHFNAAASMDKTFGTFVAKTHVHFPRKSPYWTYLQVFQAAMICPCPFAGRCCRSLDLGSRRIGSGGRTEVFVTVCDHGGVALQFQ